MITAVALASYAMPNIRRHKEGNHRRFKLTAEASAIAERQPKTSEYIFPYDPKSVSAALTL